MDRGDLAASLDLLGQALDDKNAALASSIVNALSPTTGPEFLGKVLQSYAAERAPIDNETANILIDLAQPLSTAVRTTKDSTWVAPNLSTEVKELLAYLTSTVATTTLKAGSPNWMMMPMDTWIHLQELIGGAVDVHALT